MSWGDDRGRHGIKCFICGGRGFWGAAIVLGKLQHRPCVDCQGTGFVRHCVACHGKGTLWLGPNGLGSSDYLDCPECEGKGYPKPKRLQVQTTGLLTVKQNR